MNHGARQGLIGVATAAYSATTGAAAGLVWPALAPHPSVVAVLTGQEAPSKQLLGIDVWFAGIGVVCGIGCAAVVLWLRRSPVAGTAVVLGLAAGGVLASLVADRVGYLTQHAQRAQAVAAVSRLARHATRAQIDSYVGLADFRVHSIGVLLAWPLAAVVVTAVAAMASGERRAAQSAVAPGGRR